ncbi:MAG: hypothetical protein WAV13_03955 [Thermodesulfovibrionales bacterium]
MSLTTALKFGVDIRGITPECVLGILVAAQVYEARGVPFVVTSVKDSKHMAASLHYFGKAFDCRLPSRYTHDPETDKRVHADLKEALGPQFDVILESDHIHCEHDPKAKP